MIELLVASLVVWRLTSLIVEEDLPFGISESLRKLGKPFSCFYCFSFWVALPIVLFIGHGLGYAIAVSALAIMFQSILERLERVHKL